VGLKPQFRFNHVLCFLFAAVCFDLGWHSDDETLYGKNTTIGSVSLGSARDFLLRRNADHQDKLTFKLCKGDILIMQGSTQSFWMHCVPKRLRVKEPRINLTFRKVLNNESAS